MTMIGTPQESVAGERRVALTPDSVSRLVKLGHGCCIESGAGAQAGFDDHSYMEAGAEILADAEAVWRASDVVVRVQPSSVAEIDRMRPDQTLVSFIWPTDNADLLERARERGGSIVAMDMVPRISRAQKMDALSSMANIAGYRAVIEAGANYGRFFTGQVTAAGKVPPAKVLVIGAGVAGLAAIGTAVSLGAVVKAFDVRPEVAEQIESLGAEFLFLDFSEDGGGDGGYAKPSSPEFRDKQLALFAEQAPDTDIVITTALIPGVGAPKLWLNSMVEAMKPGSIIVDLAAEKGGNCDATEIDRAIVTPNGVTVIGYTDFPSRMAAQSSSLYATNVFHMLCELLPDGGVAHDMEDDVIRGATVAHRGAVTFPPPPPRTAAIARPPARPPAAETPQEARLREREAFRAATRRQVGLLVGGGLAMLVIGQFAPPAFMQHLIVFVLSCFVGFQVIWNVAHALHTPLMSVTNAISGIIIVGALLQVGSASGLATGLAALSILIATINIVGGFYVTRRMLAMFQRS